MYRHLNQVTIELSNHRVLNKFLDIHLFKINELSSVRLSQSRLNS